MKKTIKVAAILASVIVMVGCNIEEEKTPQFCTNVENSKIQGEPATGFRTVSKVNLDNGRTIIGYVDQGSLIPHSVCSPAKVERENGTVKFSWYEFGQKMQKNIHSILFYTNVNQQLSMKASKLGREGQWQFEWVENGQVTKQEWLNETNYSKVVAVNDFEGNEILESTITIGDTIKKKRFDDNAKQFNCIWRTKTNITKDEGCVNEASFDKSIIGIIVDSDKYINALKNAKVNYETNQEKLYESIRKYF
ncbi:hypothetical protein M3923_002870 [Vibrio metschnikovii]|nr:hypothetical protein [Vibrio metschnikovii]